ncbi:MAG: ketopantoate reductase family protein, partial [Candidatus Hodarchaeota archaeon]
SWQEHAEAMKKYGLRIQGKTGEQLIKVNALFIDELSSLKEKYDVLFIAVKSNDTEKVLNSVKPCLADDAWVLSAQNGINEDV